MYCSSSYFAMVFCYQNCSSDRANLLKFEAEGRDFAKLLWSLEQFIQTVKGQSNLEKANPFCYYILSYGHQLDRNLR